jgi:hypothetical protein
VLAVVLVDQNISVTSLAISHVDDGLVGVLERPLLDPGLDLLLGSEVQHVLDLSGGADTATADLDTVAEQGEGVDVGQGATVGSTVRLLVWQFTEAARICEERSS